MQDYLNNKSQVESFLFLIIFCEDQCSKLQHSFKNRLLQKMHLGAYDTESLLRLQSSTVALRADSATGNIKNKGSAVQFSSVTKSRELADLQHFHVSACGLKLQSDAEKCTEFFFPRTQRFNWRLVPLMFKGFSHFLK